MYHLVARAAPGTVLFREWAEGLALWDILVRTFPEAVAICVMPDHVHLVLPHADPAARLARAMSAYTRWRNHHRRARGTVWQAHPPAQAIPDDQHLARTIRYVALNPCRARLAPDPLTWPLSTHRDAVGLAGRPVVAVRRDAERHHAYVSADPTVDVAGTPLPSLPYADVTWPDIRDAACQVLRVLPAALATRGPARTLAVKAAWHHGLRDPAVLRRESGLGRTALWETVAEVPPRGARLDDPALNAIVRVVGDARFGPLWLGDLRRTQAWTRYRDRR